MLLIATVILAWTREETVSGVRAENAAMLAPLEVTVWLPTLARRIVPESPPAPLALKFLAVVGANSRALAWMLIRARA